MDFWSFEGHLVPSRKGNGPEKLQNWENPQIHEILPDPRFAYGTASSGAESIIMWQAWDMEKVFSGYTDIQLADASCPLISIPLTDITLHGYL